MTIAQDAFDRLKSLYEVANKDRIHWKQKAEELQADNDRLRADMEAILNSVKS